MKDPAEAVKYARTNLMSYVPTQPVLQLLTSCLYTTDDNEDEEQMDGSNGHGDTNGFGGETNGHGGMDIDGEDNHPGTFKSPYTHDSAPLVSLFRAEFCRRHGWSKEEPLEVVVDLGSRGGALNAIEKARRVMGERLGSVRKWTDLPVSVPFSAFGAIADRVDGNTAANVEAISFGIRLPCQQRTSDRDEPAADAVVWTRLGLGELSKDRQGNVSCIHSGSLDGFWAER